MTRILEIETYPCLMPKRREWTQHGIDRTLGHRILLRLRTDDGIEGWGESTAQPEWGGMGGRYFGETAETVVHVIHDLLAPSVLRADVRTPKAIMDSLDRIIVGHPYAKATIEMALQDIRGKVCGEPLFRLFGGPCREGIRIGHMIGLMTDDEAVDEAERCIALDGITAFQIKGGTDAKRDVMLIERLRKALPENIFLRLDANKGYGRIEKELSGTVRALEAAGINAIEQPAASVAGLRACRAAVGVPIIADEACWTAQDVLELWQASAVDAISVYVAKAGGMAHAADVARTAALLGYRCDINGSLETGIGIAASMQVALAAETLTLPSIIPVPSRKEQHLTEFAGRYWEDDVVDRGFSYKSGYLHLGDAPGLGIDVDPAKVRMYLSGEPRMSRV